MNRKEPLYRKVNTITHGVSHGGGDFKWARNSRLSRGEKPSRGPMHSKTLHGLDYTPLFKFLLSRVGQFWDLVHSEAVQRLDREEPIFWIVARSESEKKDFVRTGESTYFSRLYVDDEGRLALVNPGLNVDDMKPFCACCTHTLNGVPFTRKFIAE